jgi:Domain of unknown function (DUF1906)
LGTLSGVRGERGVGTLVAPVVVAFFAAVALMSASGGAAATQQARAGVFTGFGFDKCTAPSTAALDAWAASPYRAVGIYLGGVNRACADGNLSATWVSTTLSMGWSLLPLYVGLQAPCVGQAKLSLISSNVTTATTQGTAAADDAIARAEGFGLPAGSPIYYDMEGYSTTNPTCTKAVQAFVSGWVGELRAGSFVAGVYGSAGSTIRDIALLGPSMPDDAWIANWNGVQGVFGDKYVSDSLWANHQRVHQYKGGHNETYGGVTMDIDSNFVDGAVVGGIIAAPPTQPIGFPAGSVGSGDSKATASWPDGAFTDPVVVTLTPSTPAALASAAYSVQLAVARSDASVVTQFAAPVTIHITPPSAGLVPAFSADGTTAKAVAQLSSPALPAGVQVGYTTETDGSVDILTLVPGWFGLGADLTPPSAPGPVTARFLRGALTLAWLPATDNGGPVSSYDILLDGSPVASVPGSSRRAVVHAFHPAAQTVYRVRAVDAAGNDGKSSQAIVVLPTKRPLDLPRQVPRWAFGLFASQHGHGSRPAATPRKLPAWYWHWAAWRLAPFHLRR